MSPTAFAIVDRPRFDVAWPLGRLASERGDHDAHANDAAQAAAETLAAAEARAKQARQKRAAERGRSAQDAPTARSKSQRGIGPREKVFGPGRLVPLDRNAKVRVMMVARALMRHQEKGKGLRQDQREGAGGAHRAALALPQRRDRQVLPRHTRRSPRPPAAPGARRTRRSAPLSRSASCPG